MDLNIFDNKAITKDQLLEYMLEINNDFPIPLSEKSDLNSTAEKLINYGDIFFYFENNQIVGLIGGYSNNKVTGEAYVSVLGIIEQYQGKGLATKLVNKFISNSERKEMNSVFLYTHKTNIAAIKLYEKIGFKIVETLEKGDLFLKKKLD